MWNVFIYFNGEYKNQLPTIFLSGLKAMNKVTLYGTIYSVPNWINKKKMVLCIFGWTTKLNWVLDNQLLDSSSKEKNWMKNRIFLRRQFIQISFQMFPLFPAKSVCVLVLSKLFDIETELLVDSNLRTIILL